MNRNSNTYTIVYSAIIVILIAAGLATLSIALKEPQENNRRVERMQNILASFGKGVVPRGANRISFIEKQFATYIVDSYTVGVDGSRREGQNTFDIEIRTQLLLPPEERTLPVFVAQDDGSRIYIVPVHGAGLWGAIWGYIAIADDGSTIVGAVFDHAGETPGLGAEISTPHFYDQFIGKRLFDGDRFVSISVVRPGSAAASVHSVDGISGGTITSRGVNDMLLNSLGEYKAFFLNLRRERLAAEPAAIDKESTSAAAEANEAAVEENK